MNCLEVFVLENNKLIDTHAHLLKDSYGDNLDKKIEENLNSVETIFNISWNIETSKEVLRLNEIFPSLKPVIGVHPSNINDDNIDEVKRFLLSTIKNKRPSAIGEIGIDLFRIKDNLPKQIIYFEEQLKIAEKYNIPVVLHIREAYNEAYNIMKNYRNVKYLIHSWTSDITNLKMFMNLSDDIYFGINGIITFKNAKELNESVLAIPINRILLETDSPFLAPVPFRGKINEPKNVIEIAKHLSKKLKIDLNDLIKITNANVEEFFNES